MTYTSSTYKYDPKTRLIQYDVLCPFCGKEQITGQSTFGDIQATNYNITVRCLSCKHNVHFTVIVDDKGNLYVPGGLYADCHGRIFRVHENGIDRTLTWDPVPTRGLHAYVTSMSGGLRTVDALYVGLLYHSTVELAKELMT